MTFLAWSWRLRSTFSWRSRLVSIAFLTRMSVFSTESGFSRKSKAPSLVARTAVSMVPWPEIMMTSGAFSSSRTFSSVSSPSIPGNQMSSRIMSKDFFFRSSRQASPLAAADVLYPSSSRMPCSDSRIADSSSTMSTLSIGDARRCGRRTCGQRQFDHEPRAHRMVFFNPNRAVMVFDNPADNRKPQASAPLLRGEVWQEQTLLHLLRDSLSAVGNADLNRVTACHQGRGNLNLLHH